MRKRTPFTRGDGALTRDPAAFTALYRRHVEDVVVYFARRTFDPEAARDLAAETFAAAFEGRARFRGTTAEESAAWIFGIARHQLSRYLRRGGAERRAVQRLGIEVPDMSDQDIERLLDLAGLAEARQRLASALDGVGPDQQRALWLRIVEERSYAEVASCLGVSEQVARARVSRGLRALTAATDPMTIEGAAA